MNIFQRLDPMQDAIKTCGATKIESLTYRGSYALIGMKDGDLADLAWSYNFCFYRWPPTRRPGGFLIDATVRGFVWS